MVRLLLSNVEGRYEVESMLFSYVVVLSLSAGMCLSTCFAVFKWSNVYEDAGHGTMFMTFACLFLWTFLFLIHTIFVYLNDRWNTLERPQLFYTSVFAEVLFNAISMWFTLSAYELKRRILQPRTRQSSRHAMKLYTIVIYSIAFIVFAALFVVDLIGYTHFSPDEEEEMLAAWILSYITWVTWAIRLSSLFYAVVTVIKLRFHRHELSDKALPNSLMVIVLLFVALNMPYLVVAPFSEYTIVLTDENYYTTPALSAMKTLTYSSGSVISVIMGFSISGFDTFFSPPKKEVTKYNGQQRPSPFFVMTEYTETPTIVAR